MGKYLTHSFAIYALLKAGRASKYGIVMEKIGPFLHIVLIGEQVSRSAQTGHSLYPSENLYTILIYGSPVCTYLDVINEKFKHLNGVSGAVSGLIKHQPLYRG